MASVPSRLISTLFREALRVTRSGRLVMFSSYTPQFWEHRLEWFEIQSAHHLIGEIDYQATGNGMIVCKDGFRATTADRQSFEKLAASLEVIPRITEVDGSCLFCTVFRERRPYMRRGSLCQQAVHRFENALDTFGN